MRPLLVLALTVLPTVGSAAPFGAADMMRLLRIADPQPSPDGRYVLFSGTRVEADLSKNTDLYPDCSDMACQEKRLAAEGKPSAVRVYERLPVRHWDHWEDQRFSHLLIVDLQGRVVTDLNAGADRDVPPYQVQGPDNFAVSP